MAIKYLEELHNLNFQSFGRTLGNRPMLTREILALERQFNNSEPFPAVLRELLLIAGNGCPLVDLGYSDLQNKIRIQVSASGNTILRPYFGFDFRDNSSFNFVYTDENKDDPKVYVAELYPSFTGTEFLADSETTLLRLLKFRIDRIKRGLSIY
jgi:hypothetical protein